MAFQATFSANFTEFNQAIQNAIPNVDLFEFKVRGTQSALQRMVSDFDGTKVIREAQLMSAAVEKVGGATKLTEAEQKRYNAAVTEAVTKMNALGQEATEEWKKIAEETRKAAEETGKIGVGTKQGEGSLLSLGSVAKQVGGVLAGAFTVQAVASFAKDVIDLGGEISDLSARTGISTDAIQELKYAADQTGTTIDNVTSAIEKMGINLVRGEAGTVNAVEALGLELHELRAMSPDQAFTAIADAVAQIPDPMRQTEVATKLLGKSAAEALPAMKAGLSDLREQAHDLGQVMSKDAVEGLDTLGDAWSTFIGRAKTGVGELISELTKAAKALNDLVPKGSPGSGPDIISKADVAGEIKKQVAEQERIARILASVKPPPGVKIGGDLGIDPVDLKAIGEATDRQMKAAEAAIQYAKAVKAIGDAWRAADVTAQLQKMEAAFRSLTPQQQNNAAIAGKVLEEYSKLRVQVGPSGLPRDLEAFYRAHLPVIDGVKQLIDVTGRYTTSTLPDLSRRTQEVRNQLIGLTSEGLIPTSKAFGDLFNKMNVPTPKSLGDVAKQVNETKTETVDFGSAIDDLARSWSQLAQIRPLEGWIQDVAQLIQLMSIGQQVGQQFADILTKKNKDGSFSFNWSNLMGGGGAGNAIASYAGLANAGIQGYTAIAQATDVQGRGNRAARGAIAGASIGANPALAAATGGWSVVIGAVAGAIVGALRNPGFEQEMKRIANEFGVNIGEKLAREIDKLKKQFGGDRNAAEIFSIDKIIKDAGGLNDQNIKAFTGKLRDVFVMVDIGKFAVEDARNVLDRSFGLFAENLRKSESIASKSFQDIIRLNKEFGVNSEAVQQFVSEQTSVLGGSVANLAAPLVQRNEEFKRQIEEQQKANTGATGSEEQARGQERLNAILAAQKEFAAGSADEFERLGVIAVGAFNAAVNSGADWLTAVENMGPALDTLLQLQKNLGIESQNAGLAELTHFRDLVNNNQALVLSTQALGETMQALSSIGGINIETLKAMEDQGVTTFARLTAAGFTEQQALRQMRGFLMNVIEAHEQLGTPIDENTQKLIDQAKEAGILKKDADSMLTVMKTGFADVVASLDRVARGLGIVIPEAVDETRRALDGIPRDIGVNVHIDYNDPGHTPDISGATASNWDGPSMANGGVGNFGRGTLAMLHGREAIIPLDRMGNSSRSVIRVPVYLDGRIITEVVAENLPGLLSFHGA